MACPTGAPEIPEEQYQNHMQTIHGGSQAVAKAKEQNLPKQAPVVLDKDAPPSDDFMEIAKMMDQPKPKPEPPATRTEAPAPVPPFVQEVKKEIILKYKYEGTCPTCNVPVRTIVVQAVGQTVAVALCLDHGDIKQREVPDLGEEKSIERIKEEITIREVGENHGKRHKPKLAKNEPKISSTYDNQYRREVKNL